MRRGRGRWRENEWKTRKTKKEKEKKRETLSPSPFPLCEQRNKAEYFLHAKRYRCRWHVTSVPGSSLIKSNSAVGERSQRNQIQKRKKQDKKREKSREGEAARYKRKKRNICYHSTAQHSTEQRGREGYKTRFDGVVRRFWWRIERI